MKYQLVAAHLNDEIPRLGCGQRTFLVESARKWTTVYDLHTAKKARVTTKRWETVKIKVMEDEPLHIIMRLALGNTTCSYESFRRLIKHLVEAANASVDN